MGVRPTVLALVVAALLGSTACSTDRDGEPAAGPGPANLSFTAETLDGKIFDGASLAGRPAVLWFWAPWCATCAGQAPVVTDVAVQYQGKLTMVGVAGHGELKEMREFVSDTKVSGFVQVADQSGAVWKRFGVTAQSVYVLLDRGGAVVHKGWLDSEQFEAAVARLAG